MSETRIGVIGCGYSDSVLDDWCADDVVIATPERVSLEEFASR